jgi:hypothetical protein
MSAITNREADASIEEHIHAAAILTGDAPAVRRTLLVAMAMAQVVGADIERVASLPGLPPGLVAELRFIGSRVAKAEKKK